MLDLCGTLLGILGAQPSVPYHRSIQTRDQCAAWRSALGVRVVNRCLGTHAQAGYRERKLFVTASLLSTMDVTLRRKRGSFFVFDTSFVTL